MSLKYLSAPTKTLATSLNSSGMVLRVSDIKGWNGLDLTASDFGTIAYIVLRNATNTAIEIIEIDATTIAAGDITINKRGLKFEGDRTTEVAANKLAWVQGSTLVDLGASTPQMLQTLQENFEAAIIAGGVPATTSVLGLNRMSVAPVDPAVPIALGENDERVPTADEKAALAGGGDFGAPSATNKFITQQVVTNIQEFTATGTWTKPAVGKLAFVEIWGAGASGGAVKALNDSNAYATGGGGGAYRSFFIALSLLEATEAATVGVGGAAVTSSVNDNDDKDGNHGTISWFKLSSFSANPGVRGRAFSTDNLSTLTGGAGGAAGTGPQTFEAGGSGENNNGNTSPGESTVLSGPGGGGAFARSGDTSVSAGGASLIGDKAAGAGAATRNAGGATAVAGNTASGGGAAAVFNGSGDAVSGKGGDGFIRVTVL